MALVIDPVISSQRVGDIIVRSVRFASRVKICLPKLIFKFFNAEISRHYPIHVSFAAYDLLLNTSRLKTRRLAYWPDKKTVGIARRWYDKKPFFKKTLRRLQRYVYQVVMLR